MPPTLNQLDMEKSKKKTQLNSASTNKGKRLPKDNNQLNENKTSNKCNSIGERTPCVPRTNEQQT